MFFHLVRGKLDQIWKPERNKASSAPCCQVQNVARLSSFPGYACGGLWSTSTNQRCTDLATHTNSTNWQRSQLSKMTWMLSRMEICCWVYVCVHMFRVGCPQLGLDTQCAQLLAPGHTMPSSSCRHKCSHTQRKPGLSWLPTTTPEPIPVVSLLESYSPPGSQITTLTWWLIWLDLYWHPHTQFSHLPQWLAPWTSVSLRPEIPLQFLALKSTHWTPGIRCHHRHTDPPACGLAAVTSSYTQTQERPSSRKRVKKEC